MSGNKRIHYYKFNRILRETCHLSMHDMTMLGRTYIFFLCHLKHAHVLRQHVGKQKNATSSPQVIFSACVDTIVAAGRLKVLPEKKFIGEWATTCG